MTESHAKKLKAFPQKSQSHAETRMHSSRMHTVLSLPYGGLPDREPPGRDPPGQRPPWTDTPPRGQTNTCENITFTNFVDGR